MTAFSSSTAGHDRLPAVLELQNAIAASALSVDAALSLIVERAADLTGADAAAIAFAEGDELVYTSASGEAIQHLGLRVRIDASLSGTAVRDEAIVRSDDVSRDTRVDAAAAAQVGAISMVCVPVRRYGRAVGVMCAYSGQKAAFDDGDVNVLGFLSGILAAQMANADEVERRQSMILHDSITGLGNRRAYDERLAREVARSGRHGHALSLLLLDLAGEADESVLRAVGSALRGLRRSDECFRIGPAAFAVLLPDTESLGAAFVAERLCARINAGAGIAPYAGLAEMRSPDPVELHAGAEDRLKAALAGARPVARHH